MPGKTILLTSGKGGVGKTTSTANISAALATKDPNLNICMIDMDIGLRNLDIQFGLENRIVYNLVDVIEGNCKLKQAVVRDKRLPNLCLMPAAQTRDKNAVTPEQVRDLIDEMRDSFDLILIDSPAGIEQGFHNSAIAADEAVIIVTPEISAVRDADRVIGLLESYPNDINCWLVVNRLNPKMVQSNDMMRVDDILDILGIRLLGVVPEDSGIVVSTNRGEPIVICQKESGQNQIQRGAAQAYMNIAARLTGEEVPLMNIFPEEQNLFVKQINKLKALLGVKEG